MIESSGWIVFTITGLVLDIIGIFLLSRPILSHFKVPDIIELEEDVKKINAKKITLNFLDMIPTIISIRIHILISLIIVTFGFVLQMIGSIIQYYT